MRVPRALCSQRPHATYDTAIARQMIGARTASVSQKLAPRGRQRRRVGARSPRGELAPNAAGCMSSCTNAMWLLPSSLISALIISAESETVPQGRLADAVRGSLVWEVWGQRRRGKSREVRRRNGGAPPQHKTRIMKTRPHVGGCGCQARVHASRWLTYPPKAGIWACRQTQPASPPPAAQKT